MKDNLELERDDIRIDDDMEVDCDIGQQITAYIETWFDPVRKFGLQADLQEGEWLNMYAKYDPFAGTLRIECELCREDLNSTFYYTPTKAEAQLIKDMITEKIQQLHGQTPQQYCWTAQPGVEPVFIYNNRALHSPDGIIERGMRLRAYCKSHGYEQDGSLSISAPLSRCATECKWISDYCRSHGISKILVDSQQDIGKTPAEFDRTVGALCALGLQVEVADQELVYSAKEDVEPQDEDQGLTMGGM